MFGEIFVLAVVLVIIGVVIHAVRGAARPPRDGYRAGPGDRRRRNTGCDAGAGFIHTGDYGGGISGSHHHHHHDSDASSSHSGSDGGWFGGGDSRGGGDCGGGGDGGGGGGD